MKKIDHVAIAVFNIESRLRFYREVLGLILEGFNVIEDQKVRVAIFRSGDSKIELLEPTADNSPIKKFLDKRGEGLHHIAYEVDDIKKTIANILNHGYAMIDSEPRSSANGTLIAFAHPTATFGVLTEFCQKRC